MGVRLGTVSSVFVVGSLLLNPLVALSEDKPSQVAPPPVKDNIKVKQPASPQDVLIVQLTDNADRAKFDELLQEIHGTVINTLSFGPKLQMLVIQAEPGKADEVAKRLSKEKDVANVERNRSYHINNDQKTPPAGQ